MTKAYSKTNEMTFNDLSVEWYCGVGHAGFQAKPWAWRSPVMINEHFERLGSRSHVRASRIATLLDWAAHRKSLGLLASSLGVEAGDPSCSLALALDRDSQLATLGRRPDPRSFMSQARAMMLKSKAAPSTE